MFQNISIWPFLFVRYLLWNNQRVSFWLRRIWLHKWTHFSRLKKSFCQHSLALENPSKCRCRVPAKIAICLNLKYEYFILISLLYIWEIEVDFLAIRENNSSFAFVKDLKSKKKILVTNKTQKNYVCITLREFNPAFAS